MWQPLCNKGNTSNIRMTTILEDVDCLDCRNLLWSKRIQLGLSKQINRIRRAGLWASD